MIFNETKLQGAYVIEMERREDERGFFARGWCSKEAQAHGLTASMVQANVSYNKKEGTLRGMHFQVEPYGEAKLVRCVRGGIYDVIVDLRPGSLTFCQWLGVMLTQDNSSMLYVPQGCAHGYLTLTDDAEIYYLVSEFYTQAAERGVRYDDTAFNIVWPETRELIISAKDQSWPDFIASSSVPTFLTANKGMQ